MVLDFLAAMYFGNTLLSWIYFFSTIIIFVLVAKTTIYFTKGFGRKITNNIKGEIDDHFLDLIEEPIAFLIILLGIYVGHFFLTMDSPIKFYLINILKLLFIITITWIVIRLVDLLLNTFFKPIIGKTKTRYDDQLIQLLGKLLKTLAITIAAIITLENFGVDVFTLIAGLGIGGLAFAFAAQKTIADAFGGLSILISRPFILGDTIEFSGTFGTVEEISLRHTKIRNLDKRLVIIPNSTLSSAIITNITSATKRKTVWKLDLTHNTSVEKIEKAKKIIVKAIKDCELCEEAPTVAFDEFSSSSLKILIIFYTKNNSWADMIKAKEQVAFKIKKEFEKNKIKFAFPTQTIYLEK